ncbi:MAG: GDSL-type esterase/lipase family protein [Nitrospira sp.]
MLSFLKVTIVLCAAGLFAPFLAGGAESAVLKGSTGMGSNKESAKTLVILGASYAGGWLSDQPVGGYRVVNKGVSGQQSHEMLARFEIDVVVLNPNAVLIWGFINDIFRSDQAKIRETLDRTRKSMQAMVDSAKKSGIVPILATEVTIRGRDGWKETIGDLVGSLLGKASYQEYVNGHVRETNRWIRDLAVREQIQLLDFETALADQQGVRRRDLSKLDGSHISQKGYEALTHYAEERLKVVPEH